MIEERYAKKVREYVKIHKQNGYSEHLYEVVFVCSLDDETQALGLTEDYLNKAIELAQQGLSERDFDYEFTKYRHLKEGLGWED